MKRKQLIVNIIANIMSVIGTLLIGFALTPYIVKNIGKEAYAFIPISNNFSSYMSILTVAFTSMTARFITIKIHKNDIDSANDYFSTAFYTNLALALVVSIICLFIVLFLNSVVNIPEGNFRDIQLLFLAIFASFILNLATPVFEVAAFCKNRLDITSSVSIISSITRIIVIMILFSFFKAKVFFVGISILCSTLVIAISNFIVSRRIMPELKISFKKVQLRLITELFNSSIWNAFTQLSVVLLTGLDLLIANLILGASASGTLAIAKTVPLALQSLIAAVPTAFYPHLIILYAREDRKMFLEELLYSMKISAIIVGIPIAGFISLSPIFYKLWMPMIADKQLVVLSILTMISMVASFGLMPLFYISNITNRLKWAAVCVFAVGVLNIVIVLTLIKTTNLGLYAIAGVSSILEGCRCLVFVPIYAAYCLHEKKTTFYPSIFKSLVYMIILVTFFQIISVIIPIHSWKMLIFTSVIMGIIGLVIGYIYMLNSKEKFIIRFLVWKQIQKALFSNRLS